MLRTGLYAIPLNPGKQARVEALLREYRACAATLAAGQWRLFFKGGRVDRNARLHPSTLLSARYVQTCQYQVVGALASFISNCANAFKECVLASSLEGELRMKLLYLCKYQSWYKPGVQMRGVPIDSDTLRLARNIMRAVLARHRKPDLTRCNMALDEKVAVVEAARGGRFNRWIRLSTLQAGKPVLVPVGANPWFDGIAGEAMPFVQVNRHEDGRFWAGLIKDVKPTPYRAQSGALGLDVGLDVLLATSEGDLLGRRVVDRLRVFDAQLTKLAAERQKQGLRTRSRRYDALVRRMRAWLENEVRRTLRQALLRHRPATVAVELLDFRSGRLSRRLNRLVQNFGRTMFNEALQGYAEQYGFTVEHVEPAYSSQTCHECGYVDARNRNGSKFKCLHCGHHTHADVNAARNHAHRALGDQRGGRSASAPGKPTRRALLQQIVERFATRTRLARLQRALSAAPETVLRRQERRDSSPRHCMLSNPYFDTVLRPLRAAAAGLATA